MPNHLLIFKEAFKHLDENWHEQPEHFKLKWKPYRSRFKKAQEIRSDKGVSKERIKNMLIEAGYQIAIEEKWRAPERIKLKAK